MSLIVTRGLGIEFPTGLHLIPTRGFGTIPEELVELPTFQEGVGLNVALQAFSPLGPKTGIEFPDHEGGTTFDRGPVEVTGRSAPGVAISFPEHEGETTFFRPPIVVTKSKAVRMEISFPEHEEAPKPSRGPVDVTKPRAPGVTVSRPKK